MKLRGVTSSNRCVLSPMVQYKALEGKLNDYHLVQLVSLQSAASGSFSQKTVRFSRVVV